jgi:xanthine dehydrogenase YagT iron-sulfur-binding subunit
VAAVEEQDGGAGQAVRQAERGAVHGTRLKFRETLPNAKSFHNSLLNEALPAPDGRLDVNDQPVPRSAGPDPIAEGGDLRENCLGVDSIICYGGRTLALLTVCVSHRTIWARPVISRGSRFLRDAGLTARSWRLEGLSCAELPMSPPTVVDTRPTAVPTVEIELTVNGSLRRLDLDTRTSLLDALREHLHLTGTKKGCDHGQCGACTVLINGRRINSCLTLAVMHQDDEIVTIEGLGSPGALHPMQAAFAECDGFQCGYCTPGQICSAVGMLAEVKAGWPSHATADVAASRIQLTDAEIRERMSGNICRCAAYPNIVAAIREVAEGARR